MCTHVCIYVYIYVYETYMCICVYYIHTYVYKRIHIYVYKRALWSLKAHTPVRKHMMRTCTCKHASADTHIYTYTQSLTHAHIYTYTQSLTHAHMHTHKRTRTHSHSPTPQQKWTWKTKPTPTHKHNHTPTQQHILTGLSDGKMWVCVVRPFSVKSFSGENPIKMALLKVKNHIRCKESLKSLQPYRKHLACNRRALRVTFHSSLRFTVRLSQSN